MKSVCGRSQKGQGRGPRVASGHGIRLNAHILDKKRREPGADPIETNSAPVLRRRAAPSESSPDVTVRRRRRGQTRIS
ncbi:hypothetical protein PUN28_003375 [Cardiocondyla obscurior]|uniref:Uncharacterized protein n=1 Tax=Cardiocondyla obscurior TaxID=286306 RepID=A0AAW2GKL9_9HYME